MQISRLPLPLAVVLAAFAAACSSPNNSSTTSGGSGGGNGTGNSAASGGSPSGGTPTGVSATGGNGGSPSSSGGATGTGGEDPIGGSCSKTGNTDYMSCSTSVDCMCNWYCGLEPLLGGDDAGGSVCTNKCKVTADCPDIFTSCQDGLCVANICEADGGGGAFMGPCDAMAHGDGTCEPEYSKTSEDIVGVCFQAGTVDVAAGHCDATQQAFAIVSGGTKKRPPATSLCPVGYMCVGGTCQQLCDPIADMMSDNDAGGCLDNLTCLALGDNTEFGGHCVVQGDGGCLGGGGVPEIQPCGVDMACNCPLECEIDFDSLRHVCEQTCKTTADCDIPYTSCQYPGYCNYNYCVQTYYGQPTDPLPDAGSYTHACNRESIGDGLCEPTYDATMYGNFGPFGYCEPAGTTPIGQPCGDPPFCGPNELCSSDNGGASFNCFEFCQPFLDGGNGGCVKATDGCFTTIAPPLEQVAGICLPCTMANDPNGCINSTECCDGFCFYAQPDGGGVCN